MSLLAPLFSSLIFTSCFLFLILLLSGFAQQPAAAFMGVPSLALEMRCPACIAFATALRRAAWEGHPPFDMRERGKRRKMLNNDHRCMEVLTEAMDILLQKMQFVYYSPPLPPPPHYENALLFSNKSEAPAGAIGRFWTLQDLYARRRLQVSEFRSIRDIQQRNSDESLMHFLHNEIREELGDEAEALCYFDLFHSKNLTVDDYLIAPHGEGLMEHLTLTGRWIDQQGQQITNEEDWLQLHIFKDLQLDEEDVLVWANKLCKGKTMCEGDWKKFGGGMELKEYMRSLLPINPPFVAPSQSSASGGGGGGGGLDDADEEKPLINEDF